MAQSTDSIEKVRPYTKSTTDRLYSMTRILKTINQKQIPGDIVEVGVWRGGNMILAKLMCPSRAVWLYDTFDGMTEPDHDIDVKSSSGERAIDRYWLKQEGGTKWDAVSLDEVRENFIAAGIGFDGVHFVEGPAETTVDMVAPMKIALLRLDVDWYWPTRRSLERLYSRISNGGFLIVDDYGHWAGCQKAVAEYFGRFPPRWYDVDYSCRIFNKT